LYAGQARSGWRTSRGAAEAVFRERTVPAGQVIRENAERCDRRGAAIVAPVPRALAQLRQQGSGST
jgi:16S rRNA G966 N2-methylase RsmD